LDLEINNNIINDILKNKSTQNFIKQLQNYIENNISSNIEKEDISLLNSTHNGNKIISKYRDKMLLERGHILNNYARETLNKGEMYYIYSKNSKMIDGYNLCICKEGQSHTIIEESKESLPNGAKIGSVLRKVNNAYVLDENATKEIEKEIYNMKTRLLEEQNNFLESKRIEGHIYEMSENDGDRAWLFDITSGGNEAVEEINFPIELLQNSNEGDLFAYKDGEYKRNS